MSLSTFYTVIFPVQVENVTKHPQLRVNLMYIICLNFSIISLKMDLVVLLCASCDVCSSTPSHWTLSACSFPQTEANTLCPVSPRIYTEEGGRHHSPPMNNPLTYMPYIISSIREANNCSNRVCLSVTSSILWFK